MKKFTRKKLIILPLLMILVSCQDITSSETSFSSADESGTVESSSVTVTSDGEESSTSLLESSVSSEDGPSSSEIASTTSETESSVSSFIDSSEISSSSEEEREPGIYLERTRIGVAKGKTVPIAHEVYPSNLGEVTWELLRHDPYVDVDDYPAIVTEDGQVTGVYHTLDEEFLIKGTLLDFEVYVTLMVFHDYDKKVDTFYPAHELSGAIGRGNRYQNGTTMYAGISPLYNEHYYAYDLKAGMTFNVMGRVRYNYDRPKFYYDFGRVINNKFVTLEIPFISSDGNAMLLGYDVLEDGEYIVRVIPHIEINTSSDGFSYIKYTFWF